jgi:hypothetical protein
VEQILADLGRIFDGLEHDLKNPCKSAEIRQNPPKSAQIRPNPLLICYFETIS